MNGLTVTTDSVSQHLGFGRDKRFLWEQSFLEWNDMSNVMNNHNVTSFWLFYFLCFYDLWHNIRTCCATSQNSTCPALCLLSQVFENFFFKNRKKRNNKALNSFKQIWLAFMSSSEKDVEFSFPDIVIWVWGISEL